jgi:hypothetical protein
MAKSDHIIFLKIRPGTERIMLKEHVSPSDFRPNNFDKKWSICQIDQANLMELISLRRTLYKQCFWDWPLIRVTRLGDLSPIERLAIF